MTDFSKRKHTAITTSYFSSAAINGVTDKTASAGEKLQNGDRGGGGGIMGAEGGGDLSSINAMMSAVMSAVVL